MLAAYVLLLGGLTREPDSFNQEMFDQLVNLVVIFCKIIKQRPGMFAEIEDTLKVVMQAFASSEDAAFCVEHQIQVDPRMALQTIFGFDTMLDATQSAHMATSKTVVLLVQTLFTLMSLQIPQATS